MEKIDCLFEDIYVNKHNISTIKRGENKKVTLDYGFKCYEYDAYTLILNGSQTLLFRSLYSREEAFKTLTKK